MVCVDVLADYGNGCDVGCDNQLCPVTAEPD